MYHSKHSNRRGTKTRREHGEERKGREQGEERGRERGTSSVLSLRLCVSAVTTVLFLCAILIMSISNVSAWGEGEPFSGTDSWLADVEYCNSQFTVMVSNFNHSYPNAFNYTLTYTLQYRDRDNIIQDESIAVDSYNITIGVGQYTWLSHTINTNTIMNIITEIEEDTDNPYRIVEIELDYEYCDDGGCNIGNDYKIVDFTNCDPASGTSYGDSIEAKAGTDYGFALDGKGSDAGSGGIYSGINMYGSGEGDTSGMGKGFNIIFWILIPFIFMFAVLKLSMRMI